MDNDYGQATGPIADQLSSTFECSPADGTQCLPMKNEEDSARPLAARLTGYLSFAAMRKGARTAIGPSATSRGDPVMSASGGEAVVPQTTAEVRVGPTLIVRIVDVSATIYRLSRASKISTRASPWLRVQRAIGENGLAKLLLVRTHGARRDRSRSPQPAKASFARFYLRSSSMKSKARLSFLRLIPNNII
jgi:hypothetical protein